MCQPQCPDPLLLSISIINVTETAFVTNHLNHKTAVYLGFVANTERQETCKTFYDYFMAYQPE